MWWSLPALLRQLHGDVAGAFGNAEIDAVDQRNGEGPDDLEQRMPFAGLALEGDGRFRHDMALDDDVMGGGTAHAKGFPDGINAQVWNSWECRNAKPWAPRLLLPGQRWS